jgi:hypothetical protein
VVLRHDEKVLLGGDLDTLTADASASVQQALFLRIELGAESAALAPLGDVDGVALTAADLVEDGLAREPGVGGGVVEPDVAVGDFGDEAAADVRGELMRQGACGAVCSPARSPSRSQRRMVWVQTPSWLFR